jgi:hypothetical protein
MCSRAVCIVSYLSVRLFAMYVSVISSWFPFSGFHQRQIKLLGKILCKSEHFKPNRRLPYKPVIRYSLPFLKGDANSDSHFFKVTVFYRASINGSETAAPEKKSNPFAIILKIVKYLNSQSSLRSLILHATNRIT